MKASVYTGWCEWVSEVKRSMTNEGWRVCVWYQCQGVCFCAWPAVSLNNPTCLGPTVIHSLSGNLQYGGEIKRSPRQDWWRGVMKHHGQEERAHRGRRIPLISPPPLSWRVVYREGEWGKSCSDRLDPDGDTSSGPGSLLWGTGPESSPSKPHQYKYHLGSCSKTYGWAQKAADVPSVWFTAFQGSVSLWGTWCQTSPNQPEQRVQGPNSWLLIYEPHSWK